MTWLWQLVINGLIAGCIYGLVAVGFSLVYGAVRFFHFAHGAVYAAGAYVCWALYTELGMPLTVSAMVACLAAGTVGLAIEHTVYRPLRRKNSPSLILLLASFGTFIFINNLLQLVFGAGIKTMRASVVTTGHNLLGGVVTNIQVVIILASMLLVTSLALWRSRSRNGKALRAVADDRIAAELVGVNADRMIAMVFFVGSALAGAAGVLVSFETNIEPTMGLNVILKGIIASLIGGVGSIRGALLGGILLGLAETLGTWGVSAGWKDAIAFSILVVFLLVRPGGIFNAEIQVRRV